MSVRTLLAGCARILANVSSMRTPLSLRTTAAPGSGETATGGVLCAAYDLPDSVSVMQYQSALPPPAGVHSGLRVESGTGASPLPTTKMRVVSTKLRSKVVGNSER